MTDSSATLGTASDTGVTAGERLVRDVIFTPGFDRRHPEPSKNYGISGGRLTFIVKGSKGAIQFVMGTPFYPASAVQHLINHYANDGREIAKSMAPFGWDVGCHSSVPRYEGQEPMQSHCDVIGGKCFYDGSSLQAEEWLSEFLINGTNWLWPELERRYRSTFDEESR